MRKLLMLCFGVLIVGLLNFGVVQKERIIADGATIFLKLRPVDPRSLLQGDYMRLRFEVEVQANSEINFEAIRTGNLVVRADANGVGEFVRIDDDTALAADEYAVHFASIASRPELVPDSFFFQEGEASKFEAAEYAALVFAANRRDYVLRGLADESRILINPRAALGLDLPAFLR